MGVLNTVINETHEGNRVIKLFGGQGQARDKFTQVNELIVHLNKKNYPSQRSSLAN